MLSKYSIIPMLLILFANPAICGDATPAFPPSVALELKVAEIALPQDGLVVGELVFLNIGQKPVALGANYVELTTHTGALLYELETPSGDRAEIRGWSGGDGVTFQYAELNPGEWMGTPVFLLKRNGRFLFSELGDNRMRGIVGRYGEIWISKNELKSN